MAYNPNWSSGGGGGSTAWGDITGTLSAQTDLQTAFNDKANTSSVGLKLYVQDTTPSFGVGEKAMWIDTTGANISIWIEDGA